MQITDPNPLSGNFYGFPHFVSFLSDGQDGKDSTDDNDNNGGGTTPSGGPSATDVTTDRDVS